MKVKIFLIISTTLFILFTSCKEEYTPKPRGYPKINFPEKEYRAFGNDVPFAFEYPAYGEVVKDSSAIAEAYWYNILLPPFDGTIYLSYKEVDGNLEEYIEDSRKLAYKHSIKADAINESLIRDADREVYGILYDLEGNTASSLQFFVTDSSTHFLRGSLYFYTQPDQDSLAPVISFVREDVIHLLETLMWRGG